MFEDVVVSQSPAATSRIREKSLIQIRRMIKFRIMMVVKSVVDLVVFHMNFTKDRMTKSLLMNQNLIS